MIALVALPLAVAILNAAAPQPSIFPVATRWTVDIGAPPVAEAPPATDADRIYLALRTGFVTAHAFTDGHEVWRRELTTDQPMATDAGLVFVAGAGTIHALRADDGSVAWEHPLRTLKAPLLAASGWLIAVTDGKLLALRAADGSQIWESALGAVSHRPSIDGEHLFVAVDDGRIVAMDLKTGASLWERQLGSAPGEPLAAGGRVYVGAADKNFHCLKASDGDPDWSWRTGALIVGRPAIDEVNVYFVALDNVVRALDRISGVQHWQQTIRRRAAAGPVVVGGTVLLSSASSAEIFAWTVAGRRAAVIATPGQPVVAPEVSAVGYDARLSVVTGSLSGVWQLTMIGAAGDPPLVPLSALPGVPIPELW